MVGDDERTRTTTEVRKGQAPGQLSRRDEAVQTETRNVARAVAQVTAALRAGELRAIAAAPSPRPK